MIPPRIEIVNVESMNLELGHRIARRQYVQEIIKRTRVRRNQQSDDPASSAIRSEVFDAPIVSLSKALKRIINVMRFPSTPCLGQV